MAVPEVGLMSDSLIQLQVLRGYQVPAWFTPDNRLFDDAREAFSHGELDWDASEQWTARLFNDLWAPSFSIPTSVSAIAAGAWVAPGVELQDVERDRGYCKALGVLFPAVLSARPLTGVAIYRPSDGRVIFAATGYFGNLPVLQQDVYVRWNADYGGPFRL